MGHVCRTDPPPIFFARLRDLRVFAVASGSPNSSGVGGGYGLKPALRTEHKRTPRMAASDTPNPLRQTVGRALGRIPSGVFILTTIAEPPGRFPLAMMVSWVQQAAFAPPAV